MSVDLVAKCVFITVVVVVVVAMCYWILILSIMSQPHRAVLSVLIRDGVLLTRLVVGPGIHITEAVSGAEQLTVHMDIYGSVLVVTIIDYLTLMVVRLSV